MSYGSFIKRIGMRRQLNIVPYPHLYSGCRTVISLLLLSWKLLRPSARSPSVHCMLGQFPFRDCSHFPFHTERALQGQFLHSAVSFCV